MEGNHEELLFVRSCDNHDAFRGRLRLSANATANECRPRSDDSQVHPSSGQRVSSRSRQQRLGTHSPVQVVHGGSRAGSLRSTATNNGWRNFEVASLGDLTRVSSIVSPLRCTRTVTFSARAAKRPGLLQPAWKTHG